MTQEEKQMNGTVKWFNEKKGFGFIKAEDDQDVFIHISQVPDGIMLREGNSVSFDTETTSKGLQAKNLTKNEQ